MMHLANDCLLLWAQSQRVEARGGHFTLDDLLAGLFFVACLLVGGWLLMRLLSKQEQRTRYDSPKALFQELCKAHGLDRGQRTLLIEVARWQRLRQPGRLFLERHRFDPANLSDELRGRLGELHPLRDFLFGVPSQAAETIERPALASSGTHAKSNFTSDS